MDDLIGRSFLLLSDQDPHEKTRAAVIKKIEELDQDSANRGEHIKFLLKLNNQEVVEHVITYNELLDYLEKDESSRRKMPTGLSKTSLDIKDLSPRKIHITRGVPIM